MKNITPYMVREFHERMARRYRATIIHKPSAMEVRAIAWALDAVGIADKAWFLNHFAMTIGRRVYVPWEAGVGTLKNRAYQCRVLTHEMRHVTQAKGNIGRYMALYAALPSFRASKELDAMKCDLEMHFAIYGKPMSVAKLTKTLKYYKIGWWRRMWVYRRLVAYNKGVAKGEIRRNHSIYAIKLLKSLGME